MKDSGEIGEEVHLKLPAHGVGCLEVFEKELCSVVSVVGCVKFTLEKPMEFE